MPYSDPDKRREYMREWRKCSPGALIKGAQIGNPIRKIEVQPLREPDPTHVPQETPAPEPVKEPAHAVVAVS